MSHGSVTSVSLYAGPDLQNAAELSCAQPSPGAFLRGLSNAGAVMMSAARTKLLPRRQQTVHLVRATGTARASGKPVEALYAGSGVNRAYCFSRLFENYTETVIPWVGGRKNLVRELRERLAAATFLFTENLREDALPELRSGYLCMPAWIKQQVPVSSVWSDQISTMRRATRREVTRYLRKYQFTCRVTCDSTAHTQFYGQLYLPYLQRRFGSRAHIVDRDRFLKECRRGDVLQLVQGDTVLAAALLRRTASTMSSVWAALRTDIDDGSVQGRSDVLDYFSLLYAHLQGCRTLDLGPSRPDLNDGVLRYKAKWGARINRGRFPHSMIHWTFRHDDEVATAFLREHVFVTLVAGRLVATVFVGDDRLTESLVSGLLNRYLIPGIENYRIVTLSPVNDNVQPALRDTRVNVKLVHSLPGRHLLQVFCS
jgi:hypothetical protein